MDVAELRKRIKREIERAKADTGSRQQDVDASHAAFDQLLTRVIVPLLQQSASILKSEGILCHTFTPAGSARLALDKGSFSFVEFELDPRARPPRVLGRVSHDRGSEGVLVEEHAVGGFRNMADLGDEDILEFLLPALRRLST